MSSDELPSRLADPWGFERNQDVPPTAKPDFSVQANNDSEMALFSECTQSCVQKRASHVPTLLELKFKPTDNSFRMADCSPTDHQPQLECPNDRHPKSCTDGIPGLAVEEPEGGSVDDLDVHIGKGKRPERRLKRVFRLQIPPMLISLFLRSSSSPW